MTGTPGGITPGAMSMAAGTPYGATPIGGYGAVNTPYTPSGQTPIMTPYNTPGPSITPRGAHGSGASTPRHRPRCRFTSSSTQVPKKIPGWGAKAESFKFCLFSHYVFTANS
jgi:transcription elongation factor SPT6